VVEPVGGDRPAAPAPVVGRLLLVDDNREAVDLLGDALRARGHEVRLAYDGPGALDVVRAFEPQVAFLDLGLPVMDGYELAVRLHEAAPGARLVALTGYGQESDRERSKEAGFDEHLVKPVDLETLDILIEAMLTRPRKATAART
jgi:DNA-binding response OmpR family regulator